MAGAIHGSLGHTCYEWNQLEKARSHLLRGIQLSSLSGHNAGVVYGKIFLGRVFLAQGDSPAATKAIQEAVDLLPLGIPAWVKPEVVALLVRYYLDQGNPTAIEAVLRELEISIPKEGVLPDPSSLLDPLTHREGLKSILSLRLFLHQVRVGKRLEELGGGIDLASHLIERALPVQRIEIALQALLLRAQMAAIQGNREASLNDLRQAVDLAEPEGYIRTFLDEGPEIATLLKLCLEGASRLSDRQVNFIQELLASFPATSTVQTPAKTRTQPAGPGSVENLVELLTDRELEVLRLMAEGLKYQEIAGRLVITLNTVRFYVKEIYSKLNVDNRTRAIEAAHKLNLI